MSLNYTTILNVVVLIIAAVLVVRFVRTGGRKMLAMMSSTPAPKGRGKARTTGAPSRRIERSSRHNVVARQLRPRSYLTLLVRGAAGWGRRVPTGQRYGACGNGA